MHGHVFGLILLLWHCSAVSNCLSGEFPAQHEDAVIYAADVAKDIVFKAVAKLSR